MDIELWPTHVGTHIPTDMHILHTYVCIPSMHTYIFHILCIISWYDLIIFKITFPFICEEINNSYFINASTPRTETGPLKGLTCGYHTMVIYAMDYAQVFPSREEWYKICQRMNHQSPMNRSELMKGKLDYRRTNLRRSGEPRGRVNRKEESDAWHLWEVELPGLSTQTMPVSTLGGWWCGSAGVCLAGRRPWLPSLTPHKLGISMPVLGGGEFKVILCYSSSLRPTSTETLIGEEKKHWTWKVTS